MTAEQLKASVLQMAIEGKLVPQLEEEPAVDIEAVEPEEVPFAIPEKWKWVKLKELVAIATGKKDANYGSPDGEYPFFTCSNKPIKSKDYSYDGEFLIMPGNGANIGRVIYYKGKFEAYQRTYLIRALANEIDLSYLKIHLESNWKKYNLDKMYGSAIPFIKLGNLQNYPVALPPLDEQRRIVARLNEILPLIDEYGKAHSALKNAEEALPDQLRASLLQEAIQGKLVPQLDDEPAVDIDAVEPEEVPFAIPEKWKWVRLGDVSSVISKGTTPTGGQSAYKENGIGFIRAENVGKNGKININNIKFIETELHNTVLKRSILEKNDLLICIAGTLGRSAIVEEKYLPLNTNQAVSFTRLKVELVDPWYAQLAISSDAIQQLLIGQTKVTAIPNLTLAIIRNCPIPLPPLAEQRRIVARLEELLPHVDAIAGLR